jgi:hypothetical protein
MQETNATEILPGLWLGDYLCSQDPVFINKYNIKTIINATPNFPNVFKDINYYRVAIRDRQEYVPYLKSILPLTRQIIEQKLGDGNVLIHCKRGHRRSAVILADYITQKYDINGIDFIKNRRFGTFPLTIKIIQAIV